MNDYFQFLPQEEESIIFIDTCAFYLGDGIEKNIKYISHEERLRRETDRLSILIKKLSNMGNWVTIKEVTNELQNNLDGLKYLRKRSTNKQMIATTERAIHLFKRTYKLINRKERDAISNLPENLVEKINSFLLPKVEEIFKVVGGKTSSENTDCKLVATALAYAEDTPVYIFSYDLPLLDTYSVCTTKLNLPLKGTFILDMRLKKIISTHQYYLARHLDKFQ